MGEIVSISEVPEFMEFSNGEINREHLVFSKYHRVEKKWGAEAWIVNNEKYCMKFLWVDKEKFCSIHYHKEKDETFYVRKGIIVLNLWKNLEEEGPHKLQASVPEVVLRLVQGQSIRIPPFTAHRFYSPEVDSIILEVSTTHKEEDSYRLTG